MASSSKEFPSSSSPELPPPRSRRRFPSPSIPPKRFPYDVFLSFRGADTRNSFTDHLYTALTDSGIHTFRDDDELNAGGPIQQQLMMAIEESRIAIIIFSINYAFSSWCLDELVRIIHCKKHTGKIVLPVFYHVDPADVRRQKKSFAEAFEKHQERYANELDKVEGWRSALKCAASLSGLSLQHFNGSESRLIKQILKEVLFRGNIKKLFVAKHPVGLDSRLNVIIPLLESASEDVCLLGISGMGGIGKTIIATALYNETLRHFDSSCFLENIREVSARPNGLQALQEQLLYQLSMKTTLKVGSVRRGAEMIKEMFRFKKVLIVLDDLENHEQAEALAASHRWFGPGSRIIITTRHEKLLHDVKVDATYCPEELNYDESLVLVSLHAFESKSPLDTYTVPANNLTDYCQGLPLALQVLGSFLSGKTVQEWNSAIEKLKKIQPNDIHEKLKISYDGLDDEEKEIFLDVAYFFIGMDIDYVTEILNGCGFNATIGIKVLRERCLITVDPNYELRMHDLLRDMGREIIRRTFPIEPCNRSRLWIPIDDTEIVYGNKEAGPVKGVLIAREDQEIHLHAKTFSRMPNLILLRVAEDVKLQGRFCYLSLKIRWICWQEYPLNDLPRELELINIVALDMQHSKMYSMNIQFMKHLTTLNLSHSKRLRSTLDFKKVPVLVKLVLEGCTSLHLIHRSIGCLGRLVFLNLKDCKEIKNIPSELCHLTSLECLNLNGCLKLAALPENLGEIKTLRELSADETMIKQLPSSLGLLKNLTSLSLKGCNKKSQWSWFSFFASRDNFLPPSISGLSTLQRLILRDCNLSYRDIPEDIGSLSALQELDLAGNNFSRLPQSFNQLTNLESLWLDNWNDLCSLPEISFNLKNLVHTAPQRSCPYNVFLSFAGLNTRDTFTDHLYTALVRAGIQTFRDDEVNTGGITSQVMMPAMEESRIAIIVLSTDYASSTWCLNHLVRIIECTQTKAKMLLPIFYDVDQTDVSSQMGTDFQYLPSEAASERGSFANAFQKHKVQYWGELDMVERWRCALSYTTGLSGFSLQGFNGSESMLISHIVKEVQWELKKLFVGEHLVGLESRLEELRLTLQLISKLVSVSKIVIYGAVGSGKTVMAKAFYNESLKHFESSCFLENVGAVLGRAEGDVYLQNQLLNQICKGENGVVVSSVEEGNEVIEKMCRHKKVLVVVDGLDDHIQQGNVLLANRNRYGPGSRIIVTSSSSNYSSGYDEIYWTRELNVEESVELLSWHAFGNKSLPTDDHIMLARELLSHCRGNPLAVVVLGIYLCGRSIPEWNDAVQRKRQLRTEEINYIEILIGRGSLRRQQLAFLKVAYIIQIFKGSSVNSDFGIRFLLDKYFRNYIARDASSVAKIHESLQRMGFPPPYPIIRIK